MEPLGRFLEYSMESLESILKAPLGFSTDCPNILQYRHNVPILKRGWPWSAALE